MNTEDRAAFATMLVALGEMYTKKVSGDLIGMYFEALKVYSIADIRVAFNAHAVDPDQGQFFPKPADLVRHMKGTTKTQGMVAWTKVDQAIRRIGPYPSVAFDDPTIHAVVEDMGGWAKVCSAKTEEEQSFLGNEFRTRYQGYVAQGGAKEFPKRLMGLTDGERLKHDLPVLPARLVGNAEAATNVLKIGRDGSKPLVTSPVAALLPDMTP